MFNVIVCYSFSVCFYHSAPPLTQVTCVLRGVAVKKVLGFKKNPYYNTNKGLGYDPVY